MRKASILLLGLILSLTASSQSCLPQGITFSWQADIDNFQTNYPGCTKIEGNVTIAGSDITNLNGLSVLTSIGGTLSVYAGYVSSLAGLENLTSIGDGLIIGSTSLTNLAGLENLTSVNSLWFSDNKSLASLSGIDNLTFTGNLIWIYNNDSLSDCAVQSICNYLAGTGNSKIENNATGCNSREEVEVACGVGLEENNLSENHLNIYPNPTSTNITIENPCIGQLSILNLSGQELINCRVKGKIVQVDLTNLPSGVYILRFQTDKTVEIRKVIKR